MMLRRLALSAALMLGVTLTAAQASACEGADCPPAAKSKTASKPLQLGQFMRPAATKHAVRVAKAHSGTHKPGALASHRKPAPSPTPTVAEPLREEAAAAFAAQPSVPVRVVASDELNEIDLAAGPVSPETTGLAPATDGAVQLVEAEIYNDIDRKSAELQPSLASPLDTADAATRNDPTSLSWIERFWARVQHTFVALAAGWHYLVG